MTQGTGARGKAAQDVITIVYSSCQSYTVFIWSRVRRMQDGVQGVQGCDAPATRETSFLILPRWSAAARLNSC